MLRIRLSRVGKKNKAYFRVTVAEARRTPTGRFIEILGHYDPHNKKKIFNKERIEYWISKGAQLSPTVNNLLIDAGIIKGEKVTSWRPKKKEKKEEKLVDQKTSVKEEGENKSTENKSEKSEEKTEEKK